jgi:hypothetical protein
MFELFRVKTKLPLGCTIRHRKRDERLLLFVIDVTPVYEYICT